MADPLYELLAPYFDNTSPRPSSKDPTTNIYLNRLTTLPFSSLNTVEPQSLTQTSSSLHRSLQALSKRSHKSIIASSTHLSTLSTALPSFALSTASLHSFIPRLDDTTLHFCDTYNNTLPTNSNELLDRRGQALLLSRNVDRLADILDLPTLLSSAIATSSSSNTASATQGSTTINYASALDLNSHIKRLHSLYSTSPLITSVLAEAEEAMKALTTNLIASLRHPSLKLAAAMRTISWLRRVAPELDPSPLSTTLQSGFAYPGHREGSLGSLLLVCRLANLKQTLGALEPLRALADQETLKMWNGDVTAAANGKPGKWEAGQQTERFLKRYIEVFREQSFAIISMYRSIFPPPDGKDDIKMEMQGSVAEKGNEEEDPLQPLPSALSTFPLKLMDMLAETLRNYLPNVRDRSSSDSLLTQVLYCAGSLGRLGGDFGLMLAGLNGLKGVADGDIEEEEENEDWVEVVRKHRVLAGKLELMVGAGREG